MTDVNQNCDATIFRGICVNKLLCEKNRAKQHHIVYNMRKNRVISFGEKYINLKVNFRLKKKKFIIFSSVVISLVFGILWGFVL